MADMAIAAGLFAAAFTPLLLVGVIVADARVLWREWKAAEARELDPYAGFVGFLFSSAAGQPADVVKRRKRVIGLACWLMLVLFAARFVAVRLLQTTTS